MKHVNLSRASVLTIAKLPNVGSGFSIKMFVKKSNIMDNSMPAICLYACN